MTAVEIAPGVHRLPLAPADLLNCFVLVDDDGLTLVDAGMRLTARRVRTGLASIGRSVEDVTRIVLTHAHADHAGGVRAVVAASAAPVEAHEREAVYLRDGKIPAIDRPGLLGRFVPRGFPKIEVASTFGDGDVLPYAGGLRVVHTPGHTPGHVSLLHESSGTLLVGDALINRREVRYPPAGFCTSTPLTRESAERLADLDYDAAAFCHGPEIRSGARAAVRAFLTGRVS